MHSTARPTASPGDATPLFLLAALLFGIALRMWNVLAEPSLWLDEVFSAQMALSPFRDLLLAVPRFDTHPPLYYIQLHFWALAGTSDRWLLLNSLLLDLLVIASLAQIGRRLWGGSTGLWIAAVYALMPLAVLFAENLRMYALFFLLISWLFYWLELQIRQPGMTSRSRYAAIIMLGMAASLTHGLGFFVVFFLFLQAIIRLWRIISAKATLRLAICYLPVGLCAAWSLVIGSFRQTEGLEQFDLAAISLHLTIFSLGMEAPFPYLAGWLGAALLLIPPLLLRQSRWLMAWLVLLPFAVLLVLSLGVKTVFMYRSLGLFLPFLAMALGRFFALRAPVLCSGPVLALLALAALNSSLSFHKEGYRGVAGQWLAASAPDAILITEGAINLWGITRYMPGVPAYSALEVRPPVRDGMLRLKDRLSGTWADRAGLFGKTDHLKIGEREIWPYIPWDHIVAAESYWLLDPLPLRCLRRGDQPVKTWHPEGKPLILCKKLSRGLYSGR